MFGKGVTLALVITLFSLGASQHSLTNAAKPEQQTQRPETQYSCPYGDPYSSFRVPFIDADMKAMYKIYVKAGGTSSYEAFAYVYMATYGFNPGVIQWYMWSVYHPYTDNAYPYPYEDPYYE